MKLIPIAPFVFAVALSTPAFAQYYETKSHVMIAQTPDSAKAVKCLPNATFAAGCASFTSSTVALMFPTRPVAWAQFRVEMTAHTAGDAVRLRVFQWVNGQPVDVLPPSGAPSWPEVFPTQSGAPLFGAPRSVGYYLDLAWWNSRSGQLTFVLEFRGSPTIFGAQIIEVTAP